VVIAEEAVVYVVKTCNGVLTGQYKFVPGATATTHRDPGQLRPDAATTLTARGDGGVAEPGGEAINS